MMLERRLTTDLSRLSVFSNCPWKKSSLPPIHLAVSIIEVRTSQCQRVRSHIELCLGYSAPGVEKVSQHIYDEEEVAQNRAKAPDIKESFECGDESSNTMPNIWLPDGILPGFKDACLEFYWVSRLDPYHISLTLPSSCVTSSSFPSCVRSLLGSICLRTTS